MFIEAIETLREEMDEEMLVHTDLTCDKVVKISQRLDKLIVEYYNKIKNNDKV